jgi:hypothetical protein
MATDEQIAPVISIRRGRDVDTEDPFRQFTSAGLVNARFGIDGGEPQFWGYHRPDQEWNGWDKPGFIREVAGLIADWANNNEPGNAWWEGDVLHVRGDDHVDRVTPDELGLYTFDGWAWLKVRG